MNCVTSAKETANEFISNGNKASFDEMEMLRQDLRSMNFRVGTLVDEISQLKGDETSTSTSRGSPRVSDGGL